MDAIRYECFSTAVRGSALTWTALLFQREQFTRLMRLLGSTLVRRSNGRSRGVRRREWRGSKEVGGGLLHPGEMIAERGWQWSERCDESLYCSSGSKLERGGYKRGKKELKASWSNGKDVKKAQVLSGSFETSRSILTCSLSAMDRSLLSQAHLQPLRLR